MRIRAVRWLTTTYMIVFLFAVTWPCFSLFNRVEPIILGLPFNLFCIALLIVIGMALLFLLYAVEQARDEQRGEKER